MITPPTELAAKAGRGIPAKMASESIAAGEVFMEFGSGEP
jgi:hypothetical protein